MDPASIFATIEGAGGLALKCVSLVRTLNDVGSKYKHARLTVLSMVQSLEVMQLAWERIDKWSQTYAQDGSLCMDDEKLVTRLQTSLDVGYMVMEALEDDLLPFKAHLNNFGLRDKTRFVWSESASMAHRDRLSHQVQAITCLLQTIRLESPQSRHDLLNISEPILVKSDESAYSIVPSRMSSRVSLSTIRSAESAPINYRSLACEDALFTARVYKRNYRNTMIQELFKARAAPAKTKVPHMDGRGTSRGSLTPSDPYLRKQLSVLDDSTSIDYTFMDACQRDEVINACQWDEAYIAKNFNLSNQGTPGQIVSRDAFRWSLAEALLNDRSHVAMSLLCSGSREYMSHVLKCDESWLLEKACAQPTSSILTQLLERASACGHQMNQTDLNHQLLKVSSTANSANHDTLIALLRFGADTDSADDQGFGALHLVSRCVNTVSYIAPLLNHGADIDASDNEGMTPLAYACSQGNLDNARELVIRGSNMNIRDKAGEQATDKLRKLIRQVGGIISTSKATELLCAILALCNAKTYALTSPLHPLLWEAALHQEAELIRAALCLAQGRFFTDCRTFVERSIRSLDFPSEVIKDADTSMLIDLITQAEKLHGIYLECSLNSAKSAQMLQVRMFLLQTTYQFTIFSNQQSLHDALKHLGQPVREYLSREIANFDLDESGLTVAFKIWSFKMCSASFRLAENIE